MGANLYYAQPLLAVIGSYFGVQATQAGILVTLAQLGYGLGVLFIVPLGDELDRRTLASIMLGGCVVALLIAALSPSFALMAGMSLVIGLASCATMVITPYVAAHSHAAERGRRVGQVMSGILVGIILARTFSALVTDLLGWRSVYAIAAMAVGVLCWVLRKIMLPEQRQTKVRYGRLIRSLLTLVRAEPKLRARCLYSFLGMSSFSLLWTALTFLLAAPPYGYRTSVIGSFGVIGAAGALSAAFAGRIGDRGLAGPATGIGGALLISSWAFLFAGGTSAIWLIVGIFILDLAAPGLQVIHQSVIYRLAPESRSRITAIFVTSTFAGMSLGSAAASASFARYGWSGVCVAGALPVALFVIVWASRAWAARGSVGERTGLGGQPFRDGS